MIKNQPKNKFFKIFPGLKKRKESVIKKQGVKETGSGDLRLSENSK
jgi:hypothetical protein